LHEIFSPLTDILLFDPPDNLHKLADLLLVKINDITTLNLDKTTSDTLFLEKPSPDPALFQSKTDGGQQLKVNYFCCLVKMYAWETLNCRMADFIPVFLDAKTAKTSYAKRHATVLFSKMKKWLAFQGLLQLVFTVLLSIHVMTLNDDVYNDWLIPILFFLDVVFLLTTPTTYFIFAAMVAPVMYWANKI